MMNPLRFLCARGSRSLFHSLGISLFLVIPHPGIAEQEILIGMNDVDQPGGPDELVGIDLPSGVASHLHTFSAGMNFLESLAYDKRENVLWTTNDGVLYRIELLGASTAFDVVRIGDTGLSDIDGLSVQPIRQDGSGGHLFGITHGGNDLLLIDKSDAGTSVLNSNLEVGSRLEDLSFDEDGRLFVLTSRALVQVDPLDGSRILKAFLSGASSLEGLVWWDEEAVFLSAADRGSSKDLVTINLAGEVAFLSDQSSGFRDIEALAFVPARHELVPVSLLAESISRDGDGVRLAWRAHEAVGSFVVQRSLQRLGPWQSIGELHPRLNGHPPNEAFRFTDPEAAAELQSVDLYYRVGAQDEQGSWTFLPFGLLAAPAPQALRILANAPNPFNPSTRFRVELAQPQTVSLQVFDVRGRLVHRRHLQLDIGSHELVWDGKDLGGKPLSSGIYPYVLRAGQQQLRSRAVLAK